MADDPSSDGAGHRARLRQRLIEGGPDALLEHEIIEYLLTITIPRVDTKAMAKDLIRRFGSFGALLSADAEALAREKLSDAQIGAIKLAQAVAVRLLRSKVAERPVLGSWQAVTDYLRATLAHEPVEHVRVLYLNSRNALIRDEEMSEGSVDEAAIYVREIVRRALDLHATAIIVVHNHPSGDPSPSQQDIRLTRDIVDACRHLRISVHDHIIVGASGHSSLKGMGLI
jgi:DNA repair protein RadC